jgi:hypothetical protein
MKDLGSVLAKPHRQLIGAEIMRREIRRMASHPTYLSSGIQEGTKPYFISLAFLRPSAQNHGMY